MLKRITAILLVVLSLSLVGCAASATAGLKSYIDTTDGYQFLYPNGWVPVKVNNGPDVVFHDLIEDTENVSVVISPVSNNKTLTDLGTPDEVGYKLSKNALAPEGSNRKAELVSAESREVDGKTYYILEYEVTLPNQKRHNLASVVINRDKLYTLNISTTEKRWPKMQQQFKQMINSFSVY
ncbi:MAG: photosystem II reaction center PsbP [Oscillatoriaceae bacterium SKW80]|nr:photosystem II reaction center PsbP [Oscillatoriaceae bacterium SKYG93]MCX8121437.1 photosystem II reaction center PsbP [Oscillatoriaceae bacterium SKW80]MDW8451886.1 photosystem II reaction center PsbP [Oscillatoriaceae cyanobacterium SKYGB_i_bin93]HIK29429.1 photosystem II reaction center PsbP family protein [Oscillatoriaceae cyanobacterium M7585_C2015_266]